MMNTAYEVYMNALKQGLASFDSAAAEEICAELGNVDDVLEFFRQEYATTDQPVAKVLPQQEKNSTTSEEVPHPATEEAALSPTA